MSKQLTKEQREIFADKLLSQTEIMLQSMGYFEITVQSIVEKCGVAKGTFFNYYKSKEEIFATILDKQVMSFLDYVISLFSKAKYTFEDLKKNLANCIDVVMAEYDYMLKIITLEKDVIAPKLSYDYRIKRKALYEEKYSQVKTMLKSKISILDDAHAEQIVDTLFVVFKGVQTFDNSSNDFVKMSKIVLTNYLDGVEKNIWESKY